MAFSTAYDLMRNLEKLQNRRKAVIYISSGYDFNPFEQGAAGGDGRARCTSRTPDELQSDPFFRTQQSQQMLAESDLDPRAGGADARRQPRQRHVLHDRPARPGGRAGHGRGSRRSKDWNEYIRETQDSLRVLAEETGGIAVVNQNDFDKALKRIDAETSDYYVLGYYSSNPDPLKRTRKIDVKIERGRT